MAQRMIDCDLWTNPQIVNDFTAEDKYFWLYLLTNPHNNICGICKVSNKTIANEMGYSEDCIKNLLNRFVNIHTLIDYDKENYEILIINWYKFNWSSSPKLKTYIEKVLPSIKTERFNGYITDLLNDIEEYGIDRVSIGYRYPSNTNSITNTLSINNNKKINQTKKNKETSNYYKEIIDFLNEKINARYQYSSKATQEKIKARLNEGFTVENFKNVISKKVDDWLNDEKMCRYLRPETLFGTKFESYLNEKKADKPKESTDINKAIDVINNRRNQAELAQSRVIAELRKDKSFAEAESKVGGLSFDTTKAECQGKDTAELKRQLRTAEIEYDEVLKRLGYSLSDLETKYTCQKCNDTGFINGQQCECLKKIMED